MPVAVLSTVPPDVVRDVSRFARALMAAHRTRQMYSADHPTTGGATKRLGQAMAALAAHPDLHIGVSPKTLFANGEALSTDNRLAEAATLLHDHDIISLRVSDPPTEGQIADFLQLMGFEPDRVRAQGGPERVWSGFGHKSIELVQIDYEVILAASAEPGAQTRTETAPADAARENRKAAEARDQLWTSLVQSLSGSGTAYTPDARERLRQIAQSSDDIATLVQSAVDGEEESDATRRRAAQASTVLTSFDRLVSEVESADQEQVKQTIRNIARAAAQLDPSLVMDAVEESAESGLGAAAIRGIGDAFGDDAIASLLAASLAKEGRATGRMAAALSALAPDAERQKRVLRLAEQTAPQRATGPAGDVGSAWTALEQILTGPADTLYTSSDYAFQLREMELRSHRLRLDAPKMFDSWTASVTVDSVRTLSVTLMLDLFLIEESPIGISETAQDLALLAEDLLEAGDFTKADRVLQALSSAHTAADPRRAQAARLALDRLAGSQAVTEVATAVGDLDEAQFVWFQDACKLLGPLVIPTLLPALGAGGDGPRRERLITTIIGLGDAAIGPLSSLLASEHWEHCRIGIQLLGRIGGPVAITTLQSLIGGGDRRKMREAIIALVRIADATALRFVNTALQHADRGVRLVAIDAVLAAQDRRTAPLLASTLHDLRPYGQDFPVAMQILAGMRRSSDDQAAAAVARAMHAFSWMHWRQSMTVKRTAIGVLASMTCPNAAAELAAAARQGDFLVKRYTRSIRRAGV